MPEMASQEQRLLRVNMNLLPLGGPQLRWRDLVIYGGHPLGRVVIGMHLPDGEWLNVSGEIEPLRPWHSPTFLTAFVLMTIAAAGLTLWAVRRLTEPVLYFGGGRGGPRARRKRAAAARRRPK